MFVYGKDLVSGEYNYYYIGEETAAFSSAEYLNYEAATYYLAPMTVDPSTIEVCPVTTDTPTFDQPAPYSSKTLSLSS